MGISGPVGADAHLVAAELPAEVLDLDAGLAVDLDVEARLAAGANGLSLAPAPPGPRLAAPQLSPDPLPPQRAAAVAARSAANWKYTESVFRARLGGKLVLHSQLVVAFYFSSRVNSFFKTFDGIDVMGSRLASEIQEVVLKFESLEKISFVAHSLGGLVARYAIAKLHTPQHGDAAHPSARGEGPKENELVYVDQAGSSAERARRRGHDDQDRDRAAVVAEPGTRLDNGPAPSPKASIGADTDALRTETKSDDTRDKEIPDDARQSAADNGNELKEVALAEAVAERDPRAMSKRHSNGVIAGLKPINFVTIATPHLGCRGKGQLPFLFRIGWLEKLAPALAHVFTGRTGRHLFLTDGDPPLLMRMATNCNEGQFMCVSCTPAYASALTMMEGGVLPAQPISPKYKHVMKIEESPGTDSDKSTGAASPKGSACLHGDTQQGEHTNSELEDAMAAALERVPWRRVDVSFQGAKMVWMAHNQIQVKTHWLHWEGEGVIAHVIDNLIL
eukprot:SM000040S14750  [mRNA]  locus=s40:141272:146582:+ [translate_table: standard]